MVPPKAPWPGTTTLSARAIASASAVTSTSAPAAVSAFSTLRRLPVPVSATATCGRARARVGVGVGAVALLTTGARSRGERPLGRGHAGHAWVELHRRTGGARERLEQRLDDVVGVLAVANLQVKVAQRRRDEAAEELARELGVEAADPLAFDAVGLVDEGRAAAEVDRRRHQGFIHGHQRVAVAADAGAVAQRLA